MNKLRKTLAFNIMTVSLLILISGGTGSAEESDLGPCEVALVRCLFDPLNFGTADGAAHCFLGYLFCKKYVDRV